MKTIVGLVLIAAVCVLVPHAASAAAEAEGTRKLYTLRPNDYVQHLRVPLKTAAPSPAPAAPEAEAETQPAVDMHLANLAARYFFGGTIPRASVGARKRALLFNDPASSLTKRQCNEDCEANCAVDFANGLCVHRCRLQHNCDAKPWNRKLSSAAPDNVLAIDEIDVLAIDTMQHALRFVYPLRAPNAEVAEEARKVDEKLRLALANCGSKGDAEALVSALEGFHKALVIATVGPKAHKPFERAWEGLQDRVEYVGVCVPDGGRAVPPSGPAPTEAHAHAPTPAKATEAPMPTPNPTTPEAAESTTEAAESTTEAATYAGDSLEETEEERKARRQHTVVIAAAMVGGVAVLAGLAYAGVRVAAPRKTKQAADVPAGPGLV